MVWPAAYVSCSEDGSAVFAGVGGSAAVGGRGVAPVSRIRSSTARWNWRARDAQASNSSASASGRRATASTSLSSIVAGGSSRGARAFVFEEFAKFAEANPAVECRSELGRGKHPVVRGSYVWGDDKVLDCKNRSSADVLKMAEVLRNSSGRKMLRFEKPVVSEKPSIQGPALGGAPPQVWVLPEKE